MSERKLSPERIHSMHSIGRKRAMAGRPIVTEAVIGIRNRERVREYLFGYVGFVEESLAEIGIEGPASLGIHESFQHVVVQDPTVEGLSGIDGLNDGMRLKEEDDSFGSLGYGESIHYQDGYKIGSAFARANVRKGNFEAIPIAQKISQEGTQMIKPVIKGWLEENGALKFDPSIVLALNPVVRLAFAYCISNGNAGFEDYSKKLLERLEANTEYSDEVKKLIAEGINRSPLLARKAKSSILT